VLVSWQDLAKALPGNAKAAKWETER
jgi:hypothetical protein